MRSPIKRLALLLALLASLLLGITSIQHAQHERAQQHASLLQPQNRFVALHSFESAARGAGYSHTRPQAVKIGIEINNVYNVSLPQQTFMANGSFWLQWPATVQQWLDAEGLEAQQLIAFSNNIVSYDFLVEPSLEKPRLLADGSREQAFRFSGHFWTEAIDFKHFPFQTLKIPIRFEIKPDAFALTEDRPVALIANPRQPDLLGTQIEIPGLILEGGLIEPYLHQQADDNRIHTILRESVFSQVMAAAVFSTHPTTSIGQWLIPILIVMLTVFVAPSISGSLSDMRIAVPSAALLTLVVMQQSFETSIPDLSYLTFLDLIYLWCYLITVALFILFVWSSNQLAQAHRDESENSVQRGAQLAAITAHINRIDRRFQFGSLLGTVLFVVWAFHR